MILCDVAPSHALHIGITLFEEYEAIWVLTITSKDRFYVEKRAQN